MSFNIARISFLLFAVATLLSAPAQAIIAGNHGWTALPDAPNSTQAAANVQQHPEAKQRTQQIPVDIVPGTAPRLAKYIGPDQRGVPLTAKDKLELAGWEQVQPYAFSTEVLAAAWEHLLDSDPRYGSDSAGFGERFGAAAIRQSSQAVFSDGVFAALFHQDPRYYRKGSGSIVSRIVYSATRVVVTRTDAGHAAPNYSKIVGQASTSALTMTYYPAVSATWPDTTEGYAIALATAALGNQLHEFGPDVIHLLHHHRRRR